VPSRSARGSSTSLRKIPRAYEGRRATGRMSQRSFPEEVAAAHQAMNGAAEMPRASACATGRACVQAARAGPQRVAASGQREHGHDAGVRPWLARAGPRGGRSKTWDQLGRGPEGQRAELGRRASEPLVAPRGASFCRVRRFTWRGGWSNPHDPDAPSRDWRVIMVRHPPRHVSDHAA